MAASLAAVATSIANLNAMSWTTERALTLLAFIMRMRANALDPECTIIMQRGWFDKATRTLYLRLHGAELYALRQRLEIPDLVCEDGGFFVRIADDAVVGMEQLRVAAKVISMISAQRAARGLAPYSPLSKPEARSLLALSPPELEDANLRQYAEGLWRAAMDAMEAEARAARISESPETRDSARAVQRRVVPNLFAEKRGAVQRRSYVPIGRLTSDRVFNVPLSRLDALEDRLAVLENEMANTLRENGHTDENVTLEPYVQLLSALNTMVLQETGNGIN
jgi:hypothetical protein